MGWCWCRARDQRALVAYPDDVPEPRSSGQAPRALWIAIALLLMMRNVANLFLPRWRLAELRDMA